MYINEKTLKTLEFDKIRIMLAACCSTQGAKAEAMSLVPDVYADRIRRAQTRTADARRLCDAKGAPSFGGVTDVRDICARAEKGAILTPAELLDVACVLRTSRSLLDYIRSNRLFPTVIDDVFERLIPNRQLEDRIARSIISEELISDEASAALGDIRRKIRAASVKVRETLAKYIGGGYSKFLQENIVTQRGGRYVIPVKAECKSEIKGLIHDTSSSGATIFVEPMAVVDANNELRMLEIKEAREIERILSELSADVAAISTPLGLNYENITELAFLFGCAELARKTEAVEPLILDEKKCILKGARHPLIDPKSVVPISFSLGVDFDTLIITGPNTGGKTVSLKTIGLFALMAQAGLQVPAEEGTALCVFEKILVDLGDEQSIEQSLSTFSSHMVNIVKIVNEKDDRSLVLFDELGAGTDPVEGAALAVAIIDEIRSAGALCVATTHYAELKTYALDTEGVSNASCEFDVETLRPTYRLRVGAPGRSNAFAISEKLGLSPMLIEKARSGMDADSKRFEEILGELERTRLQADRDRAEAARLKREFEEFKQVSEKEIEKRLTAAEAELNRARDKAQNMVESARASSDFILAQLDKVNKQRESERLGEELAAARKSIRENLRAHGDAFDPVIEKRDENYVLPRKLRRGDEVIIVSLSKRAVLLDEPDRSGKVLVQAGIIKTKVAVSDLKLIEEKKQEKAKSGGYKATVSHDFKGEIHLRGMTGDEAWSAVDKYFDEAQLAGFYSVRLVHGKGTGALKAALWSRLKTDKRVKSFRIGQFGEGDGGVTVVELK